MPDIFESLHSLLAQLYEDEPSIRTVLDESKIPVTEVNFDGGAIHIWHDAIKVARRYGELDALIGRACEQYPAQETRLKSALHAFHNVRQPKPAIVKKEGIPRIGWIALIVAVAIMLVIVLPRIIDNPQSHEIPTLTNTLNPTATFAPTVTSIPTPTPTPPPVVYLMDSTDPRAVYLTPGSNTYYISEILDDFLPAASIRSETIDANWDRAKTIVDLDPSLIIIHTSAFLANTQTSIQGEQPDSDQKLNSFLLDVAVDTNAWVIVYSRGYCDPNMPNTFYKQTFMKNFLKHYTAHSVTYDPAVKAKINSFDEHLIIFPVCPTDRWKNDQIRGELRRQVKLALASQQKPTPTPTS